MNIPSFPHWEKVTLAQGDELLPAFKKCDTQVSEFSFANIFLFRKTYDYQVSSLSGGRYIFQGTKDGKRFFLLPWGVEDPSFLLPLLQDFDYWKNLSEPLLSQYRDFLNMHDLALLPDRDNSDYLYDREEMASLAGRKFHKKRNHVNSFLNQYPRPTTKAIDESTLGDAMEVLTLWYTQKQEEGDMEASKDALVHREKLGLSGRVFYHDQKPIAYVMGEYLGNTRTYIVHFEKADHEIKGLYQYINQYWAQELGSQCLLINREQDLGDPGLRQAKMTYRPIGFVEKHKVALKEKTSLEERGLMEKTGVFSI